MTVSPSTSPRRAELRELWKLAIPITVAQAGQALMGFVDTAVLARAGTNSLTAVALSNAILFIVGSFGAGMLMGLEPLVSQAMGAGNDRRARTLLWQGSYLALIAGTMLALPMVVLPRVLPLFGVHFSELPLVRDYLTWRAPGLPMVLLFGTARAYVQAIERPGVLVVSMVCANVLNLVADVLLVFGGADLPAFLGPLRLVPALGVKGAALTTTLCCVLQWFIVARFIRTVPVSGGPIEIRPEWPAIRQALTVGVPIGLQLIADEGIHAITSVLARGFGPESVSAHQIALTYCMLSFTVAASIGSAGCVRVGMAVGAQDAPMTRMRAHVALSSGAAFMMCSGLLFALFPLPLARLIGAPPEVVPLLVPLLLVAALFQLSDGVLGVSVGVLRGMGDTRFPSLAIMAGHYAVGLPVGLVLAYVAGYGILGLMGGLCVGFAAMALALLWRIERLSAGVIQPLDAA